MIAAETLTLSATLFHADVDAWLPADFGIARPEAEKAAEWDAALRGAQRDRLGIGHPELLDHGARKRRETAGAGIAALRKMGKGNREEEVEPMKKRRAESDSEDESRTRAVGKKKTRAVDVFGGKKATAAVHPLLVLKKPIPGYAPSPEKDATKDDEPTDEPGALATVDAVTAAASKAQAKREKRRRAKARKAGKA